MNVKIRWRLGLVLLLMAFFAVTMSACRCAPFENEWYILNATFEKSFINGQTVEVTVGNHAHYSQPEALHNGDVNIYFDETGVVRFKPVNGETLTGTYTYSHNGFKDTGFQIKFTDGSEVTDGVAVSYYGGSELSFTYGDVFYEFIDRGYTSEEEHLENIEQIAYVMRQREYTDRFHTATTTKGTDGRWQISEVIPGEGEPPIDIYAEGFTLEAVHITQKNEVILLDELREGECFCIVLRDYNDWDAESKTLQVCGAILYYVDPLPQEPGWEDPTLKIETWLPWLSEVLQNCENAQIKITHSATALPIGFQEYHQYLRDPETVAAYLEAIRNMRLWPEEEKADFSGGYTKHTVLVTVGEQSHTVCIIGDYLVVDEKAYRFADNGVAQLPAFDYSKAVQTFRTETDLTEVYHEESYLGRITGLWKDLEFAQDTEEHDWAFAQETRKLVCDFGEVTVYDAIHFRYKGQNYVVAGEKDFQALF